MVERGDEYFKGLRQQFFDYDFKDLGSNYLRLRSDYNGISNRNVQEIDRNDRNQLYFQMNIEDYRQRELF